MLIDLIKAFLVGFCVAIPAGPVLLFVLQKTFQFGHSAGMASGVGSALIDSVYSMIGLFALSFVTDFITANEAVICIIGGILIVLIGVKMGRQREIKKSHSLKNPFSSSGFAFQTMGLVISNPGAIGAMMAALAIAGLNGATVNAPIWSVPIMVFAGEFTYWSILSFVVNRYVMINPEKLRKLSYISGMVIACVGVFLLVKGILDLL